MLVIIINEANTINTIVRYRFRIFGLFYQNKRFLVIATPFEDIPEEEEPIEETLGVTLPSFVVDFELLTSN